MLPRLALAHVSSAPLVFMLPTAVLPLVWLAWKEATPRVATARSASFVWEEVTLHRGMPARASFALLAFMLRRAMPPSVLLVREAFTRR